MKNGADDRSRTYDRLITNQLLYQLSYVSLNIIDAYTSSYEGPKFNKY